MTTIRLALGRYVASIALWLLEPHDDEPWDAARSRQIDELVAALEEAELK